VLVCIHEIGSHVFSGINYAYWPMQGAPDYDGKMAARERSLRSLREILGRAEQYGIAYCLEIVNRFEQCILNTAAEGVDYLRELDHPSAKLLLDIFHMNIEEDSFADAIRTAKGLLGHFHIGECNRKTPGTGRMPWDEIFAALRETGYDGTVGDGAVHQNGRPGRPGYPHVPRCERGRRRGRDGPARRRFRRIRQKRPAHGGLSPRAIPVRKG